MLVLSVPWLLLFLLVIAVVFFLKKKWKLASLLLLVIFAINWWTSCFCFGFNNNFSGDIKVLSFNVNGQKEIGFNNTSSIVSLINKEEPDVIFLTENYKPLKDSLFMILSLKYPYNTRYLYHNMIYSKHPISDLNYIERPYGGSAYITQCIVSIDGIELCLYGCHLSSNNYSKELEYLTPDEIDTVDKLKSYLINTKNSSFFRELEADTIVSSISERNYAIVMGDMNDICGSSCMLIFKNAGLKDAWSEGGFGYGATFHHPLPYRIDHIMYNDKLSLKGIKKIGTSGISDHDALVAVFDFDNN